MLLLLPESAGVCSCCYLGNSKIYFSKLAFARLLGFRESAEFSLWLLLKTGAVSGRTWILQGPAVILVRCVVLGEASLAVNTGFHPPCCPVALLNNHLLHSGLPGKELVTTGRLPSFS